MILKEIEMRCSFCSYKWMQTINLNEELPINSVTIRCPRCDARKEYSFRLHEKPKEKEKPLSPTKERRRKKAIIGKTGKGLVIEHEN